MEHWSIEDYKNFTNGCCIKKSKYRANKVSIDGHTFDSQKEADYYCELKLKLHAKERFDELYESYLSVASKYLPYLKTSKEDMNEESLEFIKSSFLNLKIKYDMLGLKIKKKENCKIDNVLSIKEYKAMLSKYKNSL